MDQITTVNTVESKHKNVEIPTKPLLQSSSLVSLCKVSKDMEQCPSDLKYIDHVQQYKIVPADGGWGWIVLLGCMTIHMLMPILPALFGLLFIHLVEELKLSSVMVAGYFNIQAFVWNITGAMVGPLCSEFGFRPVAIVGGFLAFIAVFLTLFASSSTYIYFAFVLPMGIGGGLSFSVCHMILPHYFERYRSLAFALTMTGVSIGQFVLPLLISYLQGEYGFRSTPLIISAVVLHCCLAGATFHPPIWHSKRVPIKNQMVSLLVKQNVTTAVKSDKKDKVNSPIVSPRVITCFGGKIKKIILNIVHLSFKNLKEIKNPTVAILALSHGCYVSAFFNFILLFPFSIVAKGYSMQIAVYCISTSAIANLVARLSIPIFAAFFKKDYAICFYAVFGHLMFASSLLVFTCIEDLTFIVIDMCFFGYGLGITMGVYTLALIEIVGLEKLPSTFGVSSFVIAFACLSMGPFTGWLRDFSQSYTVSNRFLAGVIFFGLFLWSWMPYFIRKKNRLLRAQKTPENEL